MCTHDSHEQFVKPLQFELGTGPHVWPEGHLHQIHAAAGEQLTRRACYARDVVHLGPEDNECAVEYRILQCNMAKM